MILIWREAIGILDGSRIYQGYDRQDDDVFGRAVDRLVHRTEALIAKAGPRRLAEAFICTAHTPAPATRFLGRDQKRQSNTAREETSHRAAAERAKALPRHNWRASLDTQKPRLDVTEEVPAMSKQQIDDQFSKARAAVLTYAEHLSCGEMVYDPEKFSALVEEVCAASIAWFIARERSGN